MKDMGDIHQRLGRSGLFEQAQESFNRAAREESHDQETTGSTTNTPTSSDNGTHDSSHKRSHSGHNGNAAPREAGKNGSRNKWQLPPMVDSLDFIQTPFVKPLQLIDGLLEKGSKMIIGGHSKGRKTWNLLHLAVCVATGKLWWGFPTKKGKVLYINFEIPKHHFQDRLKAIKEKLVIEGSELKGQLTVWNLRGCANDITDIIEEIIERTKDEFDLVIIDPIYKVLGDRDENSNGDVADLMNHIDRILEEADAAVIFAHHFSKGNQSKKDPMDRMSGAGVYARDADTMVTLTKHSLPETFTVDINVRNYKYIEPFCVTLDHPIRERNERHARPR